MDSPPRSVPLLLASSQRAHLEALKCRTRKDYTGHWQAISDALEKRLEADLIDPDHTDAAWAAEVTKRFDHTLVIAFYRKELGIAHDVVLAPVRDPRDAIDALDDVKVCG